MLFLFLIRGINVKHSQRRINYPAKGLKEVFIMDYGKYKDTYYIRVDKDEEIIKSILKENTTPKRERVFGTLNSKQRQF